MLHHINNHQFYKGKKSGGQGGFTLIELSMVLIIITLLIAGILRGFELNRMAKVKKLANDFRNVKVALYIYQDKFHAQPGDDANVNIHLTEATLATGSGSKGNSQIEGDWNSLSENDESYLFWEHVRLAGLISGQVAHTSDSEKASYIPRNIEGGRLGIESVSIFKSTGIVDADLPNSHAICSDLIFGKTAKEMDILLDDGETDKGAVRSIESGTMPGRSITTSGIDDDKLYTVCMMI